MRGKNLLRSGTRSKRREVRRARAFERIVVSLRVRTFVDRRSLRQGQFSRSEARDSRVWFRVSAADADTDGAFRRRITGGRPGASTGGVGRCGTAAIAIAFAFWGNGHARGEISVGNFDGRRRRRGPGG